MPSENTNENLSNHTFTQYAFKALKLWDNGDKSVDNGNQLAIYALYRAALEITQYPDNVTLEQWLTIDGSIEKARKAAWNDAVMQVVFGIDGKASKSNPDGYTKSQINRINKVMPAVLALAELGEGSCQITSSNRIKVLGALIHPDDAEAHNDIHLLNGVQGFTVEAIIRNAKKYLGYEKAEATNSTGERNQSKAAMANSVNPLAKDSGDNITNIIAAATKVFSRIDALEVSAKHEAVIGEHLQVMRQWMLELGDTVTYLDDANLSPEEAMQAIKAGLVSGTIEEAA